MDRPRFDQESLVSPRKEIKNSEPVLPLQRRHVALVEFFCTGPKMGPSRAKFRVLLHPSISWTVLVICWISWIPSTVNSALPSGHMNCFFLNISYKPPYCVHHTYF